MKYKQDMKIDESSLDLECLDQSSLMMEYGELLAAAKQKRDKAKEAMDVVRSEIDLEVRKDPGKYGLEKATESAIQNTVTKQASYQEAVSDYLDSKHEADILSGAVNAIEQRKSMLEALVKLHGQQYFAGPRVPRDLSAERQKKRDQSNSNVSKRLKRKKK